MASSRQTENPHADYLFVSRGLPKDLVLQLRDAAGCKTFVETGTYEGGTTRWAGEQFEQVFTIAAAESLHERAAASGKGQPNVEYMLGDSSKRMPEVVGRLTGPAVFWLDGHFSGGETAGADFECPVIEELDAIAESPYEHIVLIDDARLFLSAPKGGHQRDQWPTLLELIEHIKPLKGSPHLAVIADVFIIVPDKHRELLDTWCSDLADQAWRVWKHKQKSKPGLLARLFS